MLVSSLLLSIIKKFLVSFLAYSTDIPREPLSTLKNNGGC
jgi:hypothetical protein